jgi:hypothetical protein
MLNCSVCAPHRSLGRADERTHERSTNGAKLVGLNVCNQNSDDLKNERDLNTQ